MFSEALKTLCVNVQDKVWIQIIFAVLSALRSEFKVASFVGFAGTCGTEMASLLVDIVMILSILNTIQPHGFFYL